MLLAHTPSPQYLREKKEKAKEKGKGKHYTENVLHIIHQLLLSLLNYMLRSKQISLCKLFICSGGDFRHEAGADNEEEMLRSEDDRDQDDDETSERIPTAPSLYNYQSFMDKAPRVKWSKDDTDLFYKVFLQNSHKISDPFYFS